jgi:hypothetical protein
MGNLCFAASLRNNTKLNAEAVAMVRKQKNCINGSMLFGP